MVGRGAGGRGAAGRATAGFISREEANAWAREIYGEWVGTLSEEESEALTSYAGDMFGPVSEYLRTGVGDEETAEIASIIDSVLWTAPNAPAMTLWRTTAVPNLGDLFLEGEMRTRGFTSTSLVRPAQYRGGAILRISVPRNAGGVAWLGSLSPVPSEAEILIHSGARFRHTWTEGNVVYLDLVE